MKGGRRVQKSAPVPLFMYEANWESLDKRPVPAWFDQDKFGIFIHWGIYSVPAFAPKRKDVAQTGEAYAEWYGHFYKQKDGVVWNYHRQHYGEQVRYEDFAADFKAELFDPAQWAELIRKSGARYTTLVSKHHDGYCLWPSKYAWNWNTVDVGPHRDICGELKQALEKEKVKFGLYYSLYEWDRPLIKESVERYALEHMIPQMKELVNKYEPYTFFTDGEWDYESSQLHSPEFLQWLFNESPVRDRIVVNDRWGSDTRSRHGGYFTTEYGEVYIDREFDPSVQRKWEENRGIGHSFGYNRNETLEDYLSEKELILLLVDTVSKGGNLNLNIGPCADGTIPVIMEERLLQLGEWLSVNGDAIYGTTMVCREGEGKIKYTRKGNDIYAVFCDRPDHTETLKLVKSASQATILGTDVLLPISNTQDGIMLSFKEASPASMPNSSVFAVKLTDAIISVN